MTRDQVKARLILNLNGDTKGFVLWNGTETYYQKLRAAYTDISKGAKSDYLYFGFFTLCAATLEYSLNYILTDYCLKHYGHETYKRYAEGYINMSFPKKLLMAPSIISNGQLKFNEESTTFKTLCELITLRNRILHNKEFLKTFDTPSLTLDNGPDSVEFQIPMEPNYIDTLDKDLCIKFGKALGDFKNLIMDPSLDSDLKINDLLQEV
jgi:hypothetical protein